jgi:3-methyladenine DNA glycosylase/8-oxoguanine DNA glycosylase
MADTLRLVASRHAAIERAADRLPPTEFAQLLQKLRGIGPWTTGMLLGLYRAAPDAIVLADFHLPNTVAYALTGEHRADDARMVELLEPYRPHRMVVVRWIHAAGIQAPRRGHKLEAQPLPSHR